MIEINFGINVVEIVTTGNTSNPLEIFREYVQNSTDAIDDAIDAGIATPENGGWKIDITIDKTNRKITIEDNGKGIPSSPKDFVRIMSNIGNSDKSLKTDRGFRGIGRLGGLAYCQTLIFSTKAAGEKKISSLTFNAERLRQEFWGEKKRSAEAVLIENMKFETFDATPETPEHFFRVELINIVDTNKDLLNVVKVRDYLSFVAPVTYAPQFDLQVQIYAHANKIGFKITEYKIEVNGEQLVKKYNTDVRTTNDVADKIFGLEFREVHDKNKKLIAWFWFGLSQFKGVLSEKRSSESYKMRGIRLRQKNIQIGDALIFRDLFKEEQRGTKYFIGEVHTIDTNLRPNSERDDFEENEAYNNLKAALKKCFLELNDLYRTASNIRSAIRAEKAPVEEKRKFEEGRSPFRNQDELNDELFKLNEEATRATIKLDRIQLKAKTAPSMPKSEVISRVIENRTIVVPPNETKIFPPLNWSKDLRGLYETIKGVILDNKTLSGNKLLAEIIKALSK